MRPAYFNQRDQISCPALTLQQRIALSSVLMLEMSVDFLLLGATLLMAIGLLEPSNGCLVDWYSHLIFCLVGRTLGPFLGQTRGS